MGNQGVALTTQARGLTQARGIEAAARVFEEGEVMTKEYSSLGEAVSLALMLVHSSGTESEEVFFC